MNGPPVFSILGGTFWCVVSNSELRHGVATEKVTVSAEVEPEPELAEEEYHRHARAYPCSHVRMCARGSRSSRSALCHPMTDGVWPHDGSAEEGAAAPLAEGAHGSAQFSASGQAWESDAKIDAGPVQPSSLKVRFLPVSRYLLELSSGVWVLTCGVLTSREA